MSADLRAELQSRLRDAMRQRDKTAVSACRTALAAIANAEAVPVDAVPRAGAIEGSAIGVGAADAPRRELSGDHIRAIVLGEIAERDQAAQSLAATGPERAATLRAEADVLRDLLARS